MHIGKQTQRPTDPETQSFPWHLGWYLFSQTLKTDIGIWESESSTADRQRPVILNPCQLDVQSPSTPCPNRSRKSTKRHFNMTFKLASTVSFLNKIHYSKWLCLHRQRKTQSPNLFVNKLDQLELHFLWEKNKMRSCFRHQQSITTSTVNSQQSKRICCYQFKKSVSSKSLCAEVEAETSTFWSEGNKIAVRTSRVNEMKETTPFCLQLSDPSAKQRAAKEQPSEK